MSPAALKREAEKLPRELGMDEESRRRNAELRKRVDIARVEAALGEDIGAAERREREARELRKRADELALQVATGDFDRKLDGPGDKVSRPGNVLASASATEAPGT